MKRTIMILLTLIVFASCNKEKYPRYSLKTIKCVPDSLKQEHRKWITETVRAASNHMSAGDYEDVYITIRQTTWTANDLFGIKVVGLEKKINDNRSDNTLLLPSEFNESEKKIFNRLKSLH